MTTATDHEPDTGAAYHVMDVRVVEQPAAPPAEVLTGRYLLVTLTDVDTAEMLLPQSHNRVCAYVQPLDDDVVIAGQASDAENGSGTHIPKTNTSPYEVYDQGAVYVGVPVMAGASSRVSVSATYRGRP